MMGLGQRRFDATGDTGEDAKFAMDAVAPTDGGPAYFKHEFIFVIIHSICSSVGHFIPSHKQALKA